MPCCPVLLSLYCIVIVFERNKWRWRWSAKAVHSRGTRSLLRSEGFIEKVGFEPGVKVGRLSGKTEVTVIAVGGDIAPHVTVGWRRRSTLHVCWSSTHTIQRLWRVIWLLNILYLLLIVCILCFILSYILNLAPVISCSAAIGKSFMNNKR